jgi:hypothetical protein
MADHAPRSLVFILHRGTYVISVLCLPVGHLLAKNLNPAVCIILPGLVVSDCPAADIIKHICIVLYFVI